VQWGCITWRHRGRGENWLDGLAGFVEKEKTGLERPWERKGAELGFLGKTPKVRKGKKGEEESGFD